MIIYKAKIMEIINFIMIHKKIIYLMPYYSFFNSMELAFKSIKRKNMHIFIKILRK